MLTFPTHHTVTVGLLIVAVAIATNSKQQVFRNDQ